MTTDQSDPNQPRREMQDDLRQKSIKIDGAKSIDNIGSPALSTSKSFEGFLSSHRGEVLASMDLWQKLKQANNKDYPVNYEIFKKLVMDYLDEGKWLEQVYSEVPVGDEVNNNKVERRKEMKIVLRIRDDS